MTISEKPPQIDERAAPGAAALGDLYNRIEQDYQALGATPLSLMSPEELLELKGKLQALKQVQALIVELLPAKLSTEIDATKTRTDILKKGAALMAARAEQMGEVQALRDILIETNVMARQVSGTPDDQTPPDEVSALLVALEGTLTAILRDKGATHEIAEQMLDVMRFWSEKLRQELVNRYLPSGDVVQ